MLFEGDITSVQERQVLQNSFHLILIFKIQKKTKQSQRRFKKGQGGLNSIAYCQWSWKFHCGWLSIRAFGKHPWLTWASESLLNLSLMNCRFACLSAYSIGPWDLRSLWGSKKVELLRYFRVISSNFLDPDFLSQLLYLSSLSFLFHPSRSPDWGLLTQQDICDRADSSSIFVS